MVVWERSDERRRGAVMFSDGNMKEEVQSCSSREEEVQIGG